MRRSVASKPTPTARGYAPPYFPLPPDWGIDLYLKDESTHPTGSSSTGWRARCSCTACATAGSARATTVVEASSRLDGGLRGVFRPDARPAVRRGRCRRPPPEKIALIECYGGRCHLVDDPRTILPRRTARRRARRHFMDQFTYAERATDWRGNNNIAESIFEQMAAEPHPVPTWVVVGAGTGGTRRRSAATSATAATDAAVRGRPGGLGLLRQLDGRHGASPAGPRASRGSGGQRVEPSFLPKVIDRMIRVPDAASIAAMHCVHDSTGRSVGGSTGTNLGARCLLIGEMRARGERAAS